MQTTFSDADFETRVHELAEDYVDMGLERGQAYQRATQEISDLYADEAERLCEERYETGKPRGGK